jgi:hypothetical protein
MLSLALMGLTAVLAIALALWLKGEVRYALATNEPRDLGDLTALVPSPTMKDTFVQGEGTLGTVGAVRYERPLERDSFRLAPVAGNRRIWVELRVPEGTEGPKFAPPTTFVGRLVPVSDAGLRYRGLAAEVRSAAGVDLGTDPWILVDSSTPFGARWALLLAALLCAFAVWNLAAMVRIARPVQP